MDEISGLSTLHLAELYTVFRKKQPFTFSFISPWKMFSFTQNNVKKLQFNKVLTATCI